MDLRQLHDQVVDLSQQVAQWIKSQRVTSTEIELKSLNNLVSFVDKQAEQQFVDGLSALLPEAGFIAEEGTGSPSSGGLNWIIDPLDGTTNYLHGVPVWCTSVALIQDNELLLGVICDPNYGETFSAYKGSGAFLNGSPIRCSAAQKLSDALLGTGFPYDDFGRQEAYMKLLAKLTRETRGLRRPGSAAMDLAYVACGRFDGFYEYGLNPWDVAAGTLIVREAGGLVSAFRPDGDPLFDEEIVATNTAIHDELNGLIFALFVQAVE